MNAIAQHLQKLNSELNPFNCQLIAVSKTYPNEAIKLAWEAGQVNFGENKVQEMVQKYEQLPKEIQWHLIGHLQTNKVKYIAPFVHLIHSVDSLKLLAEINKEAVKNDRIISCLLQIYIAKEDTKFGLSFSEAQELLESAAFKTLSNIKIIGFMGMATNTTDETRIKLEFESLLQFSTQMKEQIHLPNVALQHNRKSVV